MQPYAVTVNTYADMQGLKHATDHGIGVGRFTMARIRLSSHRASQNVETPDGAPFATYLRGALVSELRAAGVYSDAAPVTLTGVIEDIRFSRSGPQGEWRIVLTVYSSSGISIQVDERHGSTDGPPDAFMPAVQELIAKLVQDPRFRELVHG